MRHSRRLVDFVRGIPRQRVEAEPLRAMTSRERLVEQLAFDVFSRGNKHLKTVEEITSLPEGLHSFPEICLIGRPNVGKSSVVSSLCHNFRVGRSGRRAGLTKKIEFFNIGDAFLLVDTPGYGAWGTVSQRSLAATNIHRYVSLRKKANLKHVYWVMDAESVGTNRYRHHHDSRGYHASSTTSMTARDVDIREFLRHEGVAFTVLLTKMDLVSQRDFSMKANQIYEFLGSDKIPLLGYCGKPNHPEHVDIVERLMRDMVWHCCAELADEEISFKALQSLSYLPATAAEVIAVEESYPFAAHVLPDNDAIPVEQLVRRHVDTKMAIAQSLVERGALSESAAMAAAQVPQGVGFLDSDNTGLLPQEEQVAAPILPLAEATSVLKGAGDANNIIDNHNGSSNSVATVPANHMSVACGGSGVSHLASYQSRSAVIGTCVKGLEPIPRSMVPPSVPLAASKLDKSGEAYAAMIERQGYEGVISQQDEFFVSRASDDIDNEKLRAQGRKQDSARQLSTERMLSRYVLRRRKDRSIQLDAQGVMCPWLGSTGSDTRVAGWSRPNDGERRVRGLKSSGFGGQSFSAKTMKNRGRATKKTGFWAA